MMLNRMVVSKREKTSSVETISELTTSILHSCKMSLHTWLHT